ncbi:MAG: phenylacetate--CoA ligase family protein [Planctomycetes bacterium]|nr:phenylacetate--CoA ligase family protein [Planctomycetota bacterium]
MLTDSFLTFWEAVLPRNTFYLRKLGINARTVSKSWIKDNFDSFEFTSKNELQDNQLIYPPYGDFHYLEPSDYSRFHQTSGSSGKPLLFLDSKEGWEWLLTNWLKIFELADIKKEDRLFFPFSFGPFLGFWTAFEAACKSGCLSFPGGGMSSESRLAFILNQKINVIFTTPSYAIRLAEVARNQGINLRELSLKKLVLAGEPGANIPATRLRIEKDWGRIIVDHHGMTETGPVTVECSVTPGLLHIVEQSFVAEVIDPKTQKKLSLGSIGELVLSSFGRAGCPLLRYRTGDIVQLNHQKCTCGFKGQSLLGGILSRADEMIFLKGNNIYPSALQNMLHSIEGIIDFRITFYKTDGKPELLFEVETLPNISHSIRDKLDKLIQTTFLFKPIIKIVPDGSLPRQEMKSKRFIQI